MSRRGPEGKIQDVVIKYAREKYGALCKKNEVGRFFVGSGWPDYMILGVKPVQRVARELLTARPYNVVEQHSYVFFIEFKAPGKEPTPLQEHAFKEIRTRGFAVHVVSSKEAGKKIIDAECS